MSMKKLIGLTVIWTWYVFFGAITCWLWVPILVIGLAIGALAFVVNGAAHWAGIEHDIL